MCGTFEMHLFYAIIFFSKWIKCIVRPSVDVAALLWNNLPEYNLQWMLSDYKNRNYSQFCNSINAWKTISEFERWMTISTYAMRVNLFTGGKYRPKEFINGRECLPTHSQHKDDTCIVEMWPKPGQLKKNH